MDAFGQLQTLANVYELSAERREAMQLSKLEVLAARIEGLGEAAAPLAPNPIPDAALSTPTEGGGAVEGTPTEG